jgi:hypothetical protein
MGPSGCSKERGARFCVYPAHQFIDAPDPNAAARVAAATLKPGLGLKAARGLQWSFFVSGRRRRARVGGRRAAGFSGRGTQGFG